MFLAIIICVGPGKEVGLDYANTLENVLEFTQSCTQLEFRNHISFVLLLLVSPTFHYNNVFVAEMMRGATP